MNIYLNEKSVLLVKKMLDESQVLSLGDEYGELIQELKSKLNKKKIDKNAVLTSLLVTDKMGRELLFYPRKDNGAIILTATKSTFPTNNNGFSFEWDMKTFISIANYLHEYAIFTGDNDYEVHQHNYSEEFNVYKNEVERSIYLCGSRLSFDCYTGDKADDNWTYLVPGRVKEVLRMMYANIFLHENVENYLELVHPELQEKRNNWLNAREKVEIF